MSAEWLKDPRWNLDLQTTITTSTSALSPLIAAAQSTSPATREIPLSTIVYRAAEMTASGSSATSKASKFEPLILKLREELQRFITQLPSFKYIQDMTAQFRWAASATITGVLLVWVGYSLYEMNVANKRISTLGEPSTEHPVIPITPGDDIPLPSPPPPPPKTRSLPKITSPGQVIRDIRLKLFSEILSSYLTLVFFTSALWGDTLVLQFLLCGLTGFVAMVALILPDEAEWSKGLYNYQEGGFEMADVEEIQDREVEAEPKLDMSVLKEMRDKVVERIQEAPATKKAKEIITKTKVEIKKATKKESDMAIAVPEIYDHAPSRGADDDLKAQLSKITTPINEALRADITIERASKKVEEWLHKAGDTFGANEDDLPPRYPRLAGGSGAPPASPAGNEDKDAEGAHTNLRLRLI